MRDDATWSDLWWRVRLLVRVWVREAWHPIKVRLRARRILRLAKRDTVYWYAHGERRGRPIPEHDPCSLQHGAYLQRMAERRLQNSAPSKFRGVPIRIADLEHAEPTSPPFIPRPDPTPHRETVREMIESLEASELYRHNDGHGGTRRPLTFRGIPIDEIDLDSPAHAPRRKLVAPSWFP